MKLAPLELDYIVAPSRPVWPGLLLLMVAVGISAELAMRYRGIQREQAQQETVNGLVRTDRPPAKTLPPAQLSEQAKSAEVTVRQLTLPWATLIGTLENAATKDVAVLQIQPDAQQQILRITAEARNYKAMLDYVRKLAESGTLSNVHWTNHQVQTEDPQRPLQFSIQAAFRVTR